MLLGLSVCGGGYRAGTALGSCCWPPQCPQTWQSMWACIHRSRGDLWDHPCAQPSLKPVGAQAQGVLKLHPNHLYTEILSTLLPAPA